MFSFACKYWRSIRAQSLEFMSSDPVWISYSTAPAKWLCAGLWETALELERGCQMGRSCCPHPSPSNLRKQLLISVHTTTSNGWEGRTKQMLKRILFFPPTPLLRDILIGSKENQLCSVTKLAPPSPALPFAGQLLLLTPLIRTPGR